MENFTIYNPVRLHFGRDVLASLPLALRKYGNKVLFVYGKGSVLSSGLYGRIMSQIEGFNIIEYGGIKPNPGFEDVDAAAALARRHKTDMVLAVGGGIVLDSGKLISITIPVEHSVWQFMDSSQRPSRNLPLVTVLTLAGTGSEMNSVAIIQNRNTMQKNGYSHELLFPRESFLYPQLTYSVPRNYTAFGMVDLISHALEMYFGAGNASLSDKIVFAIIKEIQEIGTKLLNDLHNYEYRARMMYAATLAFNGITANCRKSGDWAVHGLGHVLSLLYDTPHGASLSIAYPAWMKLQAKRIPERLSELGYNLFGVSNEIETLQRVEQLFTDLESPIRLQQIGIEENRRLEIAHYIEAAKISGLHHKLSSDDRALLADLMME